MKKWIVPLLIGVAIGCIIGFVMGLLALSLFNIKPNNEASYGVLEIVYYLVTPIGVLATFCAVAVALWGNEFKNYLFREKSVSSVTNNFVEVIKDENDPNPEASRYECNLSVKNCSAHEISDPLGQVLQGGLLREPRPPQDGRRRVGQRRGESPRGG